jgi:hypothetical protein
MIVGKIVNTLYIWRILSGSSDEDILRLPIRTHKLDRHGKQIQTLTIS